MLDEQLKKYTLSDLFGVDIGADAADEAGERLGRYSYLRQNGEFLDNVPGTAAWPADIHDFTIGSTMSFGPSGCSINAMHVAVPKLVEGLICGLFAGDLDHHWQTLQDYDVPVFVPDPGDNV